MRKLMVMSLLSGLSSLVISPSFAEINSCKVEVAVSSPPVTLDQSVAFNVTSDTNKSLTLKGGSAPALIDNLACSDKIDYTISATLFSSQTNNLHNNAPVGQCVLRSGPVVLANPGDSITVVFPQDFNCQ